MATETANTRDLTNAMKDLSRAIKEQVRVLAALNANLVEVGRLLKEKDGTE